MSKEMEAIISLAGNLDPSLVKAVLDAQKQLAKLDQAAKRSRDELTGKLSKAGSTMGKAVKAGFKVAGAAAAAAAVGIAKVTKDSFDAYASYEQLAGGVKTLFGDSSQTVIQNAKDAYQSAGMSANNYMETVTSFSASLLQSLGGDTAKAAEYGDKAVIDMADNANKMGTSIEDIQRAYQSFARGQYGMLDNLKLGYGGTKGEAERLIQDANKIKEANGEAGDLSLEKFSDMVDAIHLVQEQMGIMGATQEEASTTIEGSVNSAKAAYENWLTALGDDNADIGDVTQKLFDSFITAANNVVPRVLQIMNTLGAVIQQNLPIIASALATALPSLLGSLLPAAINLVGSVLSGVAAALPTLLPAIFEAITSSVDSIGTSLADAFGLNDIPILSAMFQNLSSVIMVCAVAFGVFKAAMAIGGIIQSFVTAVSAARAASEGLSTAQAILNAVMNANPFVLIASIIAAVVAALILLWNTNEGFRNAVIGIWDSIVQAFTNAWNAISSAWNGAVEFFSNLANGILDALGPVGDLLQGIGDMVGGLFGGIGDMMGGAWDAVTGFFSGTGSEAEAAASTVASAGASMESSLSGIPSTVGSSLSDTAAMTSASADEINSTLSSIGTNVDLSSLNADLSNLGSSVDLSGLGTTVSGEVDQANSALSNLGANVDLSSMTTNISTQFSTLPAEVGTYGQQAWQQFSAPWQGAGAYFQGIWSQISGAFSSGASAASAAAASIQGSLSGISGQLYSIVSAANSASSALASMSAAAARASSAGASVPRFAKGGFTAGPSLAGEDPRFPTEAVISFNPAYRSQNIRYWEMAGVMLGAKAAAGSGLSGYSQSNVSTSNSTVNLGGFKFAPEVHVNGNADQVDIVSAIESAFPEFVDMVQKAIKEQEVGNYAADF